MNKKGSIFDIFVVLVILFVVFLFFAAWMYGFGLMTGQLTAIDTPIGNSTVGQYAEDTFGQINTGLQQLRWLSLVIFFAMVLGIFVSNFLVRAHPVFFIVYILITAVAIVFSVYLSNAYESILVGSNPLTATLQSFTAMDFIVLNLPIFATIIGIAGGIFLFMGIILDKDQAGGVPI